jgi:protocatechuate 3,4-dioxygenase alpha subunit
MYFADEASANAVDPVLSKVDPGRRHLLIGTVTGGRVQFDIVLQGDDETPFFDA